MADPEWEARFSPVLYGAVEFLSNLIPGKLLYKLVEASLLSLDDLERLMDHYRRDGSTIAAEMTFRILRRRPPPSFRSFCRVLQQVEGGSDLFNLLQPSSAVKRDSSMHLHPVVAHRGVRSSSRGKTGATKRTLGSRRLAGRHLKEPTESSSAVEPNESEPKKRKGGPKRRTECESNEDLKEVLFFLTKEYESACLVHQKVVVEQCINHFCQTVYKKDAKITYTVVENLSKSVKPDLYVEVGEKVSFKIIFPHLKGKSEFKVHFENVKGQIASVMKCQPKDVEILPEDGSCTLLITVTGRAFLNLLVALTMAGSLDFLYTVENSVQLEVGTFPCVDLSLLSKILIFPRVSAKHVALVSLEQKCRKREAASESKPAPCLSVVAMGFLSRCDDRDAEKILWTKRAKMARDLFHLYSGEEAENSRNSKSQMSQYYENLEKQLKDVKNSFIDKRLSATELWSECKKMAIEMGERKTHLQLFSAAVRGLSVACTRLVKSEVDLTARTSNGFYALHLAAKNGHVSTCKVLMKSGARTDVKNNDGRQPLHLAALKGHLPTCQILIGSGAPMNDGDRNGLQPLHLAAKNGHSAVCGTLMKSKTAVNDKDHLERQPLHWAAEGGHTATCQILINGEAQLNVGDQYLRQPLHLAAMKDHSATCKLLIESGARLHDEDMHGRQPLHWAALYGYSATCNVLINFGARLHDTDNRGRQPLHWGAENGQSAACKILIEGGARLDDRDENKCQPLHLAAKNGHSGTCELLIECGARLSDEDLYGRRPLQLASIMGHGNTCRILEESEVFSGDSRYQ